MHAIILNKEQRIVTSVVYLRPYSDLVCSISRKNDNVIIILITTDNVIEIINLNSHNDIFENVA